MSANTNPKQKALVIGLIILGVLFTAFFGMRVARAFRKFDGHRPPPRGEVETDVELIRDWMTIKFISRTYAVPERILFEALDISPNSNFEKSLKDINEEYFPDQDGYVLDLIKATVQTNLPQPPTGPTPPTAPAP